MIFANWKENGSIAMIEDWTYDFLKATDDELLNNVDVGIAPSYIHIQLFKDLLEKSKVMIGSQDVDYGINARTSKISASMLKDCLLYTSPSPRDLSTSRMPSSA